MASSHVDIEMTPILNDVYVSGDLVYFNPQDISAAEVEVELLDQGYIVIDSSYSHDSVSFIVSEKSIRQIEWDIGNMQRHLTDSPDESDKVDPLLASSLRRSVARLKVVIDKRTM